MKELDKLKRKLLRVEKELDKCRTAVSSLSMDAPTTQRRWRAERVWDYWANEKFKVLKAIDEHEEKK